MMTKIEEFLSQKIDKRLLPIDADSGSYAFRLDDSFGVLIPYDHPEPIMLRFSSACIRNIEIGGKQHGNYLYFSCNDESFLHQFSLLCEDFLDSDNVAELRKNPMLWWESWKTLLGNCMRDDAVYPVIGELIVLSGLLKKNMSTVIWGGPDAALHDVETPECSYEVKSTINRSERVITVSSEHQLSSCDSKPLYLVFLVFEQRLNGGFSIEKCIHLLTDEKIRQDALKKLKKMRLEPGTPHYKDEFALLDGNVYPVNAHFPVLTRKLFESIDKDKRIQAFSYKVNIAGLECSALEKYLDVGIKL